MSGRPPNPFVGSPEKLGEKAKALLSQGRPAEAESFCRQALLFDPSNDAIGNLLGLTLLQQSRPAEAVVAFQRVLKRRPDLPNLIFNLALALFSLGKLDEAIDTLRHGVEVAPQVGQIQGKLGQLLLMRGLPDQAMKPLRKALTIDPTSVSAKLNYAEALFEVDRVDDAERVVEEVLQISQEEPNVQHALGRLRQHQGRFDEAAACFRKIVAQHPQSVAARFSLTYSDKVGEDDRGSIDEMIDMAKEKGRAAEECALLHYAIGKSFDDLAEYEPAMRHFDTANRICFEQREQAGVRFDPNVYAQSMDRIMRFCGNPSEDEGSSSVRPVFIVGMVRSGTTLLERILAAHPQVAAGGEQPYWLGRIAAIQEDVLDETWLSDSIAGYEEVLDALSPDALRVTDKMPTNYQTLGALLRAYPKASVIHCRRNPLDNGLSVYVTPYRSAPEFGHRKENIVLGYREYERLMAHWRTSFPDARIMNVDYEDLTAEFERVTRALIDFIGLEWDDRCLDPSRYAKGVRTPSQWQVSRPIYRSSVERWKNYEPWLDALRELAQTS